MRLIDADALINELCEDCLCTRDCYEVHLIKAQPTIEAEPVRHGWWEVIDAEEPRRYGCSECKRLSWNMENYCGNCGARMDGDEDE